MDEDIKNGYGKYVWANGDSYEGMWKSNKMEGPGVFRHVGDIPLEGNFKNNYFHMGGDVYVSPFQSRTEIDNFIQRRDEHRKFKESRVKEKLFQMEVTESRTQLINLIKLAAKNNRVPLCLSSKAFYINLHEVSECLKSGEELPDIEIFDIRKAKIEKKFGEGYDSYMQNIKEGLAKCMVNGGLFVINIDDSDVKYTDLYDPDLKEFYEIGVFPSQILDREKLRIKEVYGKVLEGTEYEGKILNESFMVIFFFIFNFRLWFGPSIKLMKLGILMQSRIRLRGDLRYCYH